MPAVADEVAMKPVRVDLTPAEHREFRRAAADEEVSMAALARRLIRDHLRGREDRARRR